MPAPRHILRTLPPATARMLRQKGMGIGTLAMSWRTIIGGEMAEWTRPVKLTPGRGSAPGTLEIRVEGARALEVQHRERQIIERVNTYLGRNTVQRLRLVRGSLTGASTPSAKQAQETELARRAELLEEALSQITDPGLRAALAGLGARLGADGTQGR